MSAPLDYNTSNAREGGASFPLRHRLLRAAWTLTWLLLASWTPPPMNAWRLMLLRLFGAKVASTAIVHASVRVWYPPNLVMADHACLGPRVDCYCMDKVVLGRHAVVSQGASLCGGTHSIDDEVFQLVIRPIKLADDAWIAAEAFVGPGVTIGEGAVLGARGVAFKDLAAWTVYAGNPAVALKTRPQSIVPHVG